MVAPMAIHGPAQILASTFSGADIARTIPGLHRLKWLGIESSASLGHGKGPVDLRNRQRLFFETVSRTPQVNGALLASVKHGAETSASGWGNGDFEQP